MRPFRPLLWVFNFGPFRLSISISCHPRRHLLETLCGAAPALWTQTAYFHPNFACATSQLTRVGISSFHHYEGIIPLLRCSGRFSLYSHHVEIQSQVVVEIVSLLPPRTNRGDASVAQLATFSIKTTWLRYQIYQTSCSLSYKLTSHLTPNSSLCGNFVPQQAPYEHDDNDDDVWLLCLRHM